MLNSIKSIFVISLILFESLAAFAQNGGALADISTLQPIPARRLGYKGLRVWQGHHGSLRGTFSVTDSVGQLVQYSGGIESSRNPVRILRSYPNRLRLEIQIGTSMRVLLYDGTTVTAEQGPPPVQNEIEIVLMLAKDSIEWVFGQVNLGNPLYLIHEAITPKIVDPANPKAYDVLELALPNQKVLVFVNKNNNKIESIRYWLNRRYVKAEFSNWQTGLSIQLPYKAVWQVDNQKRAELTLSRISIILR